MRISVGVLLLVSAALAWAAFAFGLWGIISMAGFLWLILH
jgi:hypothetical protein